MSLSGAVAADLGPRASPIVRDDLHASLRRRFVLGLNALAAAGTVVALVRAREHGVGAVPIGLFAVMYALTTLGVTVGYHRCFAHLSFDARPSLRVVLAVFGSMAGQGPVIYWTANHRCHHAHTDDADDPHSPYAYGAGAWARLRGFWHAHMGWMLEAHTANSMVFAGDLCRDPLIVRVNRLYLVWFALGLALPALAGGILGRSVDAALDGLLWGGLVRYLALFHATCAVNSLTHTFGTRRFATADRSTNLWWLALPTFGEGWHNNHHAFPRSARFGHRWFEADAGFAVVRLLRRLGLVGQVRVAAPERGPEAPP